MMNPLPSNLESAKLAQLVDTTAALSSAVEQLNAKAFPLLENLLAGMTTLQADVTTLRTEVTTLRTDVTTLQADVAKLRGVALGKIDGLQDTIDLVRQDKMMDLISSMQRQYQLLSSQVDELRKGAASRDLDAR